MTLRKTAPRAKSRWSLLVIAVAALTLIASMATQAALDRTLFELDKDATNDVTSTKTAVLNSAVSALATATSISVCQASASTLVGATLLIDAERMSVTATASAGGGGCPAGFGNKRTLTVGRAQGDTALGAHAKGEDVTLLTIAAVDGDDWDQVYDLIDAASDPDEEQCTSIGAVECTFSHDGRAESIFTSSKDYDEIVNWQWRDQSVPDANELDDGFAVKYVDGDGDQHVYFGADRFSTEGSKDAGFWFFHADVAPIEPVGSADGTFQGVHTAPDPGDNGVFCGNSPTPVCAPYDSDDTGGDILVLTTFTGGGATTTIRVYEWIGPAGSTAALLERATTGDCVGAPATASLCATVNNTTIESPWPYSGKNEPAADEIASGGFLEGGVNLTDLGLEGCFSSFMATTRSSPSLTADPKDWILGEFEACDTDLTTTPSDVNGDALPDTNENSIRDIQIGAGDDGADVTDSAFIDVKGTPTWEGTLDFFLCGPILAPTFDDPATTEVDESAPGETCDTGGVQIGGAPDGDPLEVSNLGGTTYTSDVANLTEVGYYCWRGEFTSGTDGVPDAADASEGECFEVLPVQPDLSTAAVDCVEEEIDEETVVTCTALEDSVSFGDPIFDRATLSGTAHQPGEVIGSEYPSINALMDTKAGGTINFKLYGPLPTDTEAEDYEEAFEAACGTLAAGFSADGISVAVDGDGDYNTFASPFEPQAPGLYAWKATYESADGNTLDASHNEACDQSAEEVTVRQIPTTIATRQRVYPNDAARIASSDPAVNLPAGGTVTFRLYDSLENCEAHGTVLGEDGLMYVEVEDVTGGATSENETTSNDSVAVPTSTTVYWWVTYDPGDEEFTGRQSDCTESVALTFTNDAGPGDLFPSAE